MKLLPPFHLRQMLSPLTWGLFLLSFCGCGPRPYEKVPMALGLPYADCTVDTEYATIEGKGHKLIFARGKRPATIDGVLYYLQKPAGLQTLSKIDSDILRTALTALPKRKLTLVIDPGHGGKDMGCHVGKTLEKELTLSIAQELTQTLEARGHKVFLTRTENQRRLTLENRVAFAAGKSIDLFISIHINSAANPEAKGTEVYTLPAPGCEGTNAGSPPRDVLAGHPHIGTATQFALAIQRSFLALPDPPMDRGIRHAHFKVLRDVPAPALLIETGFLTNVDDFARLTHPDTRKMLARAIADGIAPITP